MTQLQDKPLSSAPAPASTAELLALRQSEVPRGVSAAHPVAAVRAEGSRIWDPEGREYLDWVGGIGVLNVGHSHPAVQRAVQQQLAEFSHTCFQVVMYEPYLRLAQRLNALFPGQHPAKTLFLSTGAEAVENAVKIARAYTGRPAIVSFTHSFHGRTLLGMSLTGKKAYYTQNFGPFAPDIYHAPFPYEYHGGSVQAAVSALQEMFVTTVDPSRIAAFIVEPVLGEGGFLPLPAEFVTALRQICEQHGILLIADEIQSGAGRTGTLWACEQLGLRPDLMTFAKSIGAGLPISGVTGRAEVMDAPAAGGLGGTYAGNPLGCAAGLAVLDILEGGALEQGQALGQTLRQTFESWQKEFPQIGDVRGLGAMLAMEFTNANGTPATDLTRRIITLAREGGLLLLGAGIHGNVVRVLLPINTPQDEVQRGLNILHGAIAQAAAQQ